MLMVIECGCRENMGKDLSKIIAMLLKWVAENKIIIRDLHIIKTGIAENYILTITLAIEKDGKEICIKRAFLLGENLNFPEWNENFNSLELDDAIKSIVEYKVENENHETLSE